MKNRIDGRRLAQHIGNEVILLGTIVKVNHHKTFLSIIIATS